MQLTTCSSDSQRGQTMPFWVIGVLIVLTTVFFLANYVNTVTWQIRAQNAADSAAATALTTQANLWNEESTILYSTALDEYRIRYLNQALLNTIEGVGGCQSVSGGCSSDYQGLLAELSAAVSGYDADVQMLAQGNNFTEGGQQADAKKAQGMVGGDCGNASDYTCDFTYTALDVPGNGKGKSANNGAEAEYLACKTISYLGPALLKLGSGTTFQVLGRGAAAVLPANSEAFNPGTKINPLTAQAYQPLEQWGTAYAGPAYNVDFSGLTVNLNWYTAATIRPYSGALSAGSYSC